MARRTPPLNSLRAFEAAARLGNFARAADELSVTAAAVSHRIKELEAMLDAQLFVRQARGVRLTEAGERYHRGIARAFDEIERATVQVGEASIDGPLKVSMPQSFAQAWFASRAARLVHRWPGLVLTVDGDSRLADLRRGTVDVGLRFGPGVYADLHSEPLMADAVTVLAAPSFIQRHEGVSVAFAALQRRELKPLLPWRSSEFAYHVVTRPADSDNPRILAFRAWLLEETRDFTDAVAQALGVTLSRFGWRSPS